MAHPQPSAASTGVVYLVGAGPGDPQLITLRGAECLRRADVVIYDSLANKKLLRFASATAERVAVGHRHGSGCMKQDEINARLIAEATLGKCVVRLKGGDPFVFGRGGEEVAALAAAGIRVEVVPGVTAGIAAPAFAGIPVTHRQHASAVTLITGHEDPNKPGLLDWNALARTPGTLVFYMAVCKLHDVVAKLQAAGKAASTPSAAIEWGTTPAQRTIRGELSQIAERARAAELKAPAIVVIGPVAELADELRWFEKRPMFGQRVIVTRPAHQMASLADPLHELGAEVLELPALEIQPTDDWESVDRAIRRLAEFGWLVFTSANGVSHFFARLLDLGGDLRQLRETQLAAIGRATADELEKFYLRADLVPAEANSESLVEAFQSRSSDRPLLLVRAESARETLPLGLKASGIAFEEIAVYRACESPHWDAEVVRRIEAGQADWITATSPRTVQSVVERLSPQARAHLGTQIKIASISPLTTGAARHLGLEVAVEAKNADVDSLLEAMRDWIENRVK